MSTRHRADRPTVAAAIALLVICCLHTVAFAVHPWWGPWLAGPFRSDELPLDSVVQFWGLPGGFVIPGVLLALLVLRTARRGGTVPAYVGIVLGVWALCAWMVGPSGFVLILIPAVLLLVARARARRRSA